MCLIHRTLRKKDVQCLVHWILGRPLYSEDFAISFPELYSSTILSENNITLVYQIYEGDFYNVKKRSATLNRLFRLESTYDKDTLKTELKNLIKLNEFPSIQGTHPVLLEISKIINQLTKSHSNRFKIAS